MRFVFADLLTYLWSSGKDHTHASTPLLPCHCVVNALRPTVRDRLPVIRFVRHRKIGNMLFYFSSNFFRGKSLSRQYYKKCGQIFSGHPLPSAQ